MLQYELNLREEGSENRALQRPDQMEYRSHSGTPNTKPLSHGTRNAPAGDSDAFPRARFTKSPVCQSRDELLPLRSPGANAAPALSATCDHLNPSAHTPHSERHSMGSDADHHNDGALQRHVMALIVAHLRDHNFNQVRLRILTSISLFPASNPSTSTFIYLFIFIQFSYN